MTSPSVPSQHDRYFHGWATSFAVHGLAGGLIFLMVDRITPVSAPEPFKWNVVMQAGPSSDSTETAHAQSELATSPPPPVTKAPPSPTRDTAAHDPVVQRSPPRVDPQPVIREQVQETTPVEHSTRNVVEQTVRTTSPALIERRTESLKQPLERRNETSLVETASSQVVETPVERAPTQNTLTAEEIHSVQHTDVVQAESPHVTETHRVVHDVGPLAEPEPVVEHVASSREAVPSQSSPVVTEEIVKSMESTAVEPRVLTERTSTSVHEERPVQEATEIARLQPSFSKATGQVSPTPQADYGWLVEALRSKVQQLKRYPSIARMNNWEGRVLLRAVIKDNGEVAELEVAESSGHAALDAAAMEAMKRASPLKLPHPLGRSHVVLHVPIRYHLR